MASGSDLILGVARAADAARQREALSRLERLSQPAPSLEAAAGQASDAKDAWAAAVHRPPASAFRTAAAAPASGAADKSDKSERPPEAYVEFEAMLLQNMVETMMPSDAEATFGSGTAGQIWKSMLAEKIAAEIARSGSIGIAKQVAAGEAASIAAGRQKLPEGSKV